MANRRMFSQRIVGDESFLEMPQSTQNLYFHLGIYADDDGFVNPKKIVRMIGANPDDLKVLTTKKFVIPFESGVIVITHWKENNYIQKDRKTPTIYQNELKTLDCIQNVYELDTQVRLELGKDRLDKDNTASNEAEKCSKPDKPLKEKTDIQKIVDHFFTLKGWTKEKAKEQIYARYVRPAKELLGLCENDIAEAKNCLDIVYNWASSRNLDWSIETIFKKWYDLDNLKPKKKCQYYEGNRIFEANGRKKVIMPDGEIKDFFGNENEIVWK